MAAYSSTAGLLPHKYLVATAMIQAVYVRNIRRGGQPSEGVTVATRKTKIPNPTEGRSPITISAIRFPAHVRVRDKLLLIIKAATGRKANAEVPATTWTRPTALSSVSGVVTGSATQRPTTPVATAQYDNTITPIRPSLSRNVCRRATTRQA